MDLKVTPQMVANASANCQTTATDVESQLGALANFVASMAGWTGVAADTWAEVMVNFGRNAKELHGALVDIGEGLHGNFVNYTDLETDNNKNMAAVNELLPLLNL